MNPTLRSMVVLVGVVAIGAGIRARIYAPQPATRTVAELKDAGLLDGQRTVTTCGVRMTKQTKRRIEAVQPGLLRPSQAYGYVSWASRCFNPDGGNCLRPADGVARVADLEADHVIPSLRLDLTGVDLDASVGIDDGGDGDDVDDAFLFDMSSCLVQTCPLFDAEVDAGAKLNPYPGTSCLGAVGHLALQPAPCMMPDGWHRGADGGWCSEDSCYDPAGPALQRPCEAGDTCGVVDCRAIGPYGLPDGGPTWRGFNVLPREYAVGAACVPVSCSVVAGDAPQEWL